MDQANAPIRPPNPIMRYFAYEHLPEKLQGVSKPIGDLASMMNADLPDSPEKSAGLRKLLEAKDCLVRAALLGLAIMFALALPGCNMTDQPSTATVTQPVSNRSIDAVKGDSANNKTTVINVTGAAYMNWDAGIATTQPTPTFGKVAETVNVTTSPSNPNTSLASSPGGTTSSGDKNQAGSPGSTSAQTPTATPTNTPTVNTSIPVNITPGAGTTVPTVPVPAK